MICSTQMAAFLQQSQTSFRSSPRGITRTQDGRPEDARVKIVHKDGAIAVHNATGIAHLPLYLIVISIHLRKSRKLGDGSGEKVGECWPGIRRESPDGRAIFSDHPAHFVAGRWFVRQEEAVAAMAVARCRQGQDASEVEWQVQQRGRPTARAARNVRWVAAGDRSDGAALRQGMQTAWKRKKSATSCSRPEMSSSRSAGRSAHRGGARLAAMPEPHCDAISVKVSIRSNQARAICRAYGSAAVIIYLL